MKVLNLRCANGHGFEGWFASDDDFMSQNGRGLIECPLCADAVISRMPSAPRLNLSGARDPAVAASTAAVPAWPAAAGPAGGSPGAPVPADLHAAWLQAVRHVLAHTDDVGERFAEEARRIHYGDTAERGIRGQASADEVRELREEGIEIGQLPIPKIFNEPLQ